MKVVIQRVKEAKVEAENKVVGKIEKGFLVFLGITHTDTKEQADYLVKKLCNLRVFTDREGQVILKKYSPIGELSEFATGYAETLAKTTGHIACITDKDTVIAVSGGAKKELLEQDVSEELERLMDDKEKYTSKENSDMSMPITKNDKNEKKKNAQIVYPIISNGDTIGTVILLSKESNTKMNEVEQKVAQSAASFLGSQMEI